MMDVIGVKTNNGFYIKNLGDKYSESSLTRYIINGEAPAKTFHKLWCLVSSEPKTVTQMLKQPRINHRFELRPEIPWVDGGQLPKMFPRSEVMEDIDGSCVWKDEFKHLESLYMAVSDEQPDVETPVEFNYQTVLEVDYLKVANNFKFEVQATQYKSDGFTTLKADKIIHQELAKMFFPDIALVNTECKLSSHNSYRIIREHVKRNIDPRYAEVDSDHEFCFSVSKIIPLANPYTKKTEIKNAKGRSYHKPKYKEFTVKSRKIKQVFEMTHAGDIYRGYTCIPGFQGIDHEDLQKNIEKFLSDLMARINEPLIDCPHCDGMGVITQWNKQQKK